MTGDLCLCRSSMRLELELQSELWEKRGELSLQGNEAGCQVPVGQMGIEKPGRRDKSGGSEQRPRNARLSGGLFMSRTGGVVHQRR